MNPKKAHSVQWVRFGPNLLGEGTETEIRWMEVQNLKQMQEKSFFESEVVDKVLFTQTDLNFNYRGLVTSDS